jgi:threonine/homoserine/homoserine lactone efflux protein
MIFGKYFNGITMISTFITSFTIALSGALMPGPLLTATVSESARFGKKASFILVSGHAFLEILLVLFLFMGAAPLLSSKPVTIFTGFFGSVVLIWMAVGMIRSLPSLSLKELSAPYKKQHKLFLAGLLLSIGNPYWSVWWISIGMGYILQAYSRGPLDAIAFFFGHILADFLWYVTVGIIISKGKQLFSDNFYRILIGSCAALLVLFAVLFTYRALRLTNLVYFVLLL